MYIMDGPYHSLNIMLYAEPVEIVIYNLDVGNLVPYKFIRKLLDCMKVNLKNYLTFVANMSLLVPFINYNLH